MFYSVWPDGWFSGSCELSCFFSQFIFCSLLTLPFVIQIFMYLFNLTRCHSDTFILFHIFKDVSSVALSS